MYRASRLVAMVLVLSGCAHCQARHGYLAMDRTIVDLQMQQVLDNLARFRCNPNVMPYFSYPSAGTAQATQTGTAVVTLTWNPFTIISEALGLTGTSTDLASWNMAPINAPDRLFLMKYAYQYALGIDDKAGQAALEAFFSTYPLWAGKDPTLAPSGFAPVAWNDLIKVGWLGSGTLRDVPEGACYVSHCGDAYVWVEPHCMDDFGKFEAAMLHIALVNAGSPNPPLKPGSGEREFRLAPQTPPPQAFGPQFYPNAP